ncbi:MAG: hypothetical protein KF678_09515 [Phycisphaeraceae bacterium]|nr:hypothetical protein [Phycisphaeraceae bacterium]
MSKRKLLTPSLGQRAEYCFDPKGDQFFVGSGGGGGGGYGILLRDPALYEYVLGLLNSTLLDWYLQQITTPFHSGWFAHNKQFIEQVPIKLPTTAADKKLAERITESVRAVLAAYRATDPKGNWDPAWAKVYEPFGAGEITIKTTGKNKGTPEAAVKKAAAKEARQAVDAKILAALLKLNLERSGKQTSKSKGARSKAK